MFALAARLTTIGSISATVPVLLIKAPMAAVTSMTRMNSFSSLLPANPRMRLLTILASPVWKIAPPTTNSPIIMMTIGLANPASASSGVSIWKTSRPSSAHSATRSERTRPFIKKTADSTRIASVIYIISVVSCRMTPDVKERNPSFNYHAAAVLPQDGIACHFAVFGISNGRVCSRMRSPSGASGVLSLCAT